MVEEMEGQAKELELHSAGNGESMKHGGWHSSISRIVLSEDYLGSFWEGRWGGTGRRGSQETKILILQASVL